MNNKILLIIDPQYDFINGSLAVDGAENAMKKLSIFIHNYGTEYDKIVLTTDWHPYTHCSFNNNGGIWNPHCIQFTKGAAIYQPIIDSLEEIKADYTILTKGTNEDREEYSVFKNAKSCVKFINICNTLNIKEIDVCGIAFDYCLKDSVKDGLRYLDSVKFNVLKEFSPSIGEDSEKEFIDFVNNCERINLEKWHE